jgi:type IV pilus assembly protein PilX
MNTSYRRQQGMVLVVTLVLMLILTIVASSAMQMSTLQERLAGNTRDTVAAFQAAEAAVRVAEDVLEGASVGAFNGANGRYEICAGSDTRTACQTPDWNNRNSNDWIAIAKNLDKVAKQPEYVIERYTAVENPQASLDANKPLETYEFYRITARGYGISPNSMVVLQTTYRRN